MVKWIGLITLVVLAASACGGAGGEGGGSPPGQEVTHGDDGSPGVWDVMLWDVDRWQ